MTDIVHIRLAVVGSRGITNKDLVFNWLDRYYKATEGNMTIVSGGARGVDQLAAEYAEIKGLELVEFPAEWERYGKSAGYKRNRDIWEYATEGLIFWDGESRGTAHSFQLNVNQGKPYNVINLLTYKEGKFNENL